MCISIGKVHGVRGKRATSGSSTDISKTEHFRPLFTRPLPFLVSPDGDFVAAVPSVYLRLTLHLRPLLSYSLYHRSLNHRCFASVDTVYSLHLL